MKGFLNKKRQSKLTAWVVGGLLCASASSAANLVAAEEADPDFTAPLLGTADDQAYIDAGVRQADGTYRFTKDSLISYQNKKDEDLGAIRLLADLKIDATDHILTVKTNTNDKGNAAAVRNSGKNLDIKAGTLRLQTNADGKKYPRYAWGIRNESGTTSVAGMTEINVVGYTSSRAVEATEGKVTLEGLKAKVAKNNEAMALLAGSSGQIFVNAAGGTPGSHVVNLMGNVGAMGETSRIDVAMMNEDSGLKGLVFGKGQINFWLQNGAVWNNEGYGYALPNKNQKGLGKDYDYTFEGSRLSSLRGGSDASHAGLIFQKHDKDITVDNYSGYTRVFYEHYSYDPKSLTGGNFIIKNAAPGSSITLTRDNAGLKTDSAKAVDKNLVSEMLDALAKKLRYTAYTTHERNLTGKVEIAEGLTSSSASKRMENITFDETTGQGGYAYTPAVDAPQGKTEFTTRLSGTATDQEYADANVRLSDGTYLFQKESSIAYQSASATDSGAIKASGDVQIDAKDNALAVTSGAKTADVKEAAAIVNDEGKNVEIKAKTLKLTVNDTTSAAPLERAWGIRMSNGTVTVAGTTEIDVGGTKESKAVQVSGGKLVLDGLKVTTNSAAAESAALFAQNDGHIEVDVRTNTPKGSEVKITGHLLAKDAESRIDASFTRKNSYLKGYAYGDGKINMWLWKGAAWYHEKQGAASPAGFTGSHLSTFYGGQSPGDEGLIFQRDDKDITIDEYRGYYTNVFYEHDAAAPQKIKGGDLIVKKSWGGTITLITDSAGLNTDPAASIAEKNLISETLNSLAGKLQYTGYTKKERQLKGQVQISEGLTASSVKKRLEDITFDETTGRGKYLYTPMIEPPNAQTDTDFTTGITGSETHDVPYANAGVRKADGSYVFTKDSTITSGATVVVAGAWLGTISAAISRVNSSDPLNIDLNGKNLTVKTATEVSTTGISSIGGTSKLNIKNAGAISVDAESLIPAQTAALFVNSGGSIHIENGGDNLENKVLKVRANGKVPSHVAVIKSMNGVHGVESNITIDGLVDVLADADVKTNGKGANEAVSAVASTINIGGGTIRAINGAWAAIRAYGEFVTQNYGTVNFNVTKDKDGLANGAGKNRAVIEGDIVTNGGMGTKGRVSVGLSTPESHWIGNYADTSGYGVTPGQLGAVNLFMKNGSYWKGFSNGAMKMEMSGEGTKWTGFNVGNNLQLHLADGATWYNAIMPEQTDQSNKPAISRVRYFTGEGGFIDMRGENRFLASSKSLSGAPVQAGSSSIEEKGLGETGDLTIAEYSGSTTLLYRHDAASPTTIYGGKTTIEKAKENSTITLRTDNDGLNTNSTQAKDRNLVNATLDALAKKLTYTAYKDGERNLMGKAEIAEGLVASSVSRTGAISFDETSGAGSYKYTPVEDVSTPQEKTEYTMPLTGDMGTDGDYITSGVLKDGNKYEFSKSTAIKADHAVDATAGHKLNVSAASGTTLALQGKDAGIRAQENSQVHIDGDRVEVQATEAAGHSIQAAKGANVNLKAGFDVKGAVENIGGAITLDDAGKKSTLIGDIKQQSGSLDINLNGQGSKIESNIVSKGGAVHLSLMGDHAFFRGSIRSGMSGFCSASAMTAVSADKAAERTLEMGKTATWEVTAASDLTALKAQAGSLIKQQSAGPVNVENFSGKTKVFYKGKTTSDGALTLEHTGKFAVKNVEGTDNEVSLSTDATTGNPQTDKKVADTLAQQFVYRGDAANIEGQRIKNLKVNAVMGDTLTTSARTYEVLFQNDGTVKGVGSNPTSDLHYGDYETKLMRGVKSAMTASMMTWRAESNDLMKRMGDLRLSPEDEGVWARVYRGKSSSDKDKTNFTMNYTTIQVGYDKKVGDDWRVGVAGSYMKGSSSYESGSGENKEGNLGVYGTWTGKNGEYVDLIAKIGRLTNEYTVYNDMGHYVKGDYHTWGSALSAEYGRRIDMKDGSFIEPQIEMIYSHLNGVNYAGDTDYIGKKMYVRQSAMNSLVGRVGLGFGQETKRSTWFLKASVYHEFAGDLSTDYSDGFTPKSTKQTGKDTWLGIQLGGTTKLNDRTSLYGDFEKTFGGDIKTDWRIDAGLRWSF